VSAISPDETVSKPYRNSFRLQYVLLPALLLLLAIVMAIVFYNRLPAEVAYHFTGDTPDGWISRGAAVMWLLIPQFVLALTGLGLSGMGIFITRKGGPEDSGSFSKILTVMGNMVAIPQLVLFFILLDIFLYNAYDTPLIPLWIIVVAVTFIGSIILGIYFLQIIRQARQPDVKKISGSDR
jgi:hypothetical protein